MRVLGIESSCDECAVAVVDETPKVLSQVVSSQIPIHSVYGGVVPELASRDHIRKIIPVLKETIEKSGCAMEDFDGIGVTSGPGLIGSLLVGVTAANVLAWRYNLPLIGVNHLEGHLHAIFLEMPNYPYPHLALLVSGGHTCLVRVEGIGNIKLMGTTLDDAAGEAFDKVAKLLGLSYPGGISIEKVAASGDPNAIHFPRPLPGKRLDFSFSGLKTSVAVRVKKEGMPKGAALADFTASFQEAVVDSLVKKTRLAAKKENLDNILLAGGVAANLRLREKMQVMTAQEGWNLSYPATSLCTDNAAMVAALACAYLKQGQNHGWMLDANSSQRLQCVQST